MNDTKEVISNTDNIPVRVNIDLKKDESSSIKAINWQFTSGREEILINGRFGFISQRTGTLTIIFIPGEAIYEYYDVPLIYVEEMLHSESIGKYFHQNIKNVYKSKKIIGITGDSKR